MSKYLKIIGFSLILAISCEDAADDLADAIAAGGGMYTDSDVIGVYYGTSSYFYANGDCSGDLGTDLAGFHENTVLKFDADTLWFPPVCIDADTNMTYVEDPSECNGTYESENMELATWELVNNSILLTPIESMPIANNVTITATGVEFNFSLDAECNCDDDENDNCPETQTECEALGDAAEWREAACAKVTLTKQ